MTGLRIRQLLSWGFFDQSILSLAGFATSIILARSLSRDEFGLFTIGLTVIYLANSLQFALVTSPHSVVSQSLAPDEFNLYTTSTGVHQVLTTAGLSGSILMLATVFKVFGSANEALLFAVSAGACFAWQIQEFLRRVSYARGLIPHALACDVVSYGGQAILILVTATYSHLTPARAMGIVCLSSLAAVSLSTRLNRVALSARPNRHLVGHYLKLNWELGKWLAAGEAAAWVGGYSYLIILGASHGFASTAVIRVGQVLLGPFQVVYRFIETTLTPIASKLIYEERIDDIKRMLLASVKITTVVLVLAVSMALIFGDDILARFFGEQYRAYNYTLAVLALGSVFHVLVGLGTMTARALRNTRLVFGAYLVAAVIGIMVGAPMIVALGTSAAAAVYAANAILVCGALWKSLIPRLSSGVMSSREVV